MLSAATLLQLRPAAPLRPPNWRWRVAGEAHAEFERTGRDTPPKDLPDVWTGTALSLQRYSSEKNKTEMERAAALGSLGEAGNAYAFWTAGTVDAALDGSVPGGGTGSGAGDERMYGPLSENALAVAELEGLILARKAPAFIADHTGLPEEAIRWYERIWFDVRDRLSRPGWVSRTVIGSLHHGSVATLLPALVRAYGYYTRSARIVRAAASGFDYAAARRAARENPDRFFAADALSAGGLKAALAIRLMPLTDRKIYGRVIELHQEAQRLDAETRPEEGADKAQYRELVQELGDKVRYAFSPDRANRALPPAGGFGIVGDPEEDVG